MESVTESEVAEKSHMAHSENHLLGEGLNREPPLGCGVARFD